MDKMRPLDCGLCGTTMSWYKTISIPPDANVLMHYFSCANCGKVDVSIDAPIGPSARHPRR